MLAPLAESTGDAFFETVRKLQATLCRQLTLDELDALTKPEYTQQRADIREGAFNAKRARLLVQLLRTRITTGTMRRLSLSPHGVFFDGPLSVSERQGVSVFYAVRNSDSVIGVLKVYYPSDSPTASAEREWGVSQLLDDFAQSEPLLPYRRHVVRYSDRLDLGRGRIGLFMPAYIRSLENLMSHTAVPHLSLPDTFLLSTARSVLRGLAVMHAAGIAHCDVKSDNIMFDGDGTATLIDLGAATKLGEFVYEGIPRSMSLGLAIDRGDARVDLASLATTLWWAAYGYLDVGNSVHVLRDRAAVKALLGSHHGIVASAVAAILNAGTAVEALSSIDALARKGL